MAVLVGITTYPPNAADRYELPQEYVAAVRRAGAVPVLIAPGEPRPDDLLDRLDAVVLAGGGDIDPARWGGDNHPAIEFVDPDRDDLELALAQRILSDGVPTLAICRGLQVVNTALGGTLHPHLPDAVTTDEPHRREPKWSHTHRVSVDPGSLVARTMGTEAVEPACWHHQAIDRLGTGLAVTARSPDGVIEAVELAGHPWMAAVQWHPEMTAADDAAQQRLFDGLVEAITGGDAPGADPAGQ
jgi:putative glutamine amidotransferase